MQGKSDPVWRAYVRPLALAAVFTVPGEAMVFVCWGGAHCPDGDIVAQLLWGAASGAGMAVAIGLMVGFIVDGRYEGTIAGIISSFCYATVLVAAILIYYEVYVALDLFGVRGDPMRFVLTGVVPTFLTSPLYGWLLHGKAGKALLARIGL
ncbi:MAG: hypothetical protein IMF05_08410 [Proteobacteria bacterium]|nr:hypothetical protein [Pseudomonadota bacterium]